MNTFGDNVVDAALWTWFALTALSAAYVVYDLVARTPEMTVMKWGWALVTLYTGPVGLVVYWLSCREPAPGTHEKFVAPLWKQSVGSTIHCLAGDATGIIAAAVLTSSLRLPMGLDAAVEYLTGFAFGLFIFQALFMKDMLGGSYWQAVRGTWLAEWLSMNAVMAGMVPVMVVLMTRDMRAMEPTSPRFWGVMSLAALAGAALAYPVNWWLVRAGLKHGMGTERALGRGGSDVGLERARLASSAPTTPAVPGRGASARAHTTEAHRAAGDASAAAAGGPDGAAAPATHGGDVPPPAAASAASKWLVALATVAALAAGVALAARYGDLSMRAGGGHEMPAGAPAPHGGMKMK